MPTSSLNREFVGRSRVIFCTADKPLARFIAWWTVGYAHAALILPSGEWLDARGSGVRVRPPETGLHAHEIVELPFDIAPAFRTLVGRGYNFRGVIAQWLRFRWRSANRLFCDQAILAACRLAGHAVCEDGREDKVNPQGCCDMLRAYLRGLAHDARG